MAEAKKKTQIIKKANSQVSGFTDGLKYPWGNAKRLLNIFWALIPIIGWFALIGYCQSILRAIIAGNKTELPKFIGFGDNLKRGFLLFLKAIPLVIAYSIVSFIPLIGPLAGWFIEIFFIPYLMINLFVTDKFKESFNLRKTWDAVFNNIGEYLIAYIKTIGFALIYGLLSIVLVGIPCLAFGQGFFLAEFYANHS